MRVKVVVACALIGLLLGCGSKAGSPTRGSLSGTVVEEATFVPVAGAAVTLAGSRASTDAAGQFSLADLPVGDATLAITAAGYQPYTRTLTVAAGDHPLGQLWLKPLGDGGVIAADAAPADAAVGDGPRDGGASLDALPPLDGPPPLDAPLQLDGPLPLDAPLHFDAPRDAPPPLDAPPLDAPPQSDAPLQSDAPPQSDAIVDPCAVMSDCADCTGLANCGWCGDGTCRSGDADGPASAAGTCGGWYWFDSQCPAVNPCAVYTTCTTCPGIISGVACGWCGDTSVCVQGSSSGPSAGTCTDWNWYISDCL